MTEVFLNVYDLHSEHNAMLYGLGLGFYHSGVVIGGTEWTFASGAGIYPQSPKSVPGFRESIRLGTFKGTMRDVDTIIDSLRPAYHGGNYHILDRNCNSFAESFVLKLLNKEIPGFVNRMAFWGSLFSCLLPQHMTGQAPVGDTSGSSSSATHNGGSSGGYTMLQPSNRHGNASGRSAGITPTLNPFAGTGNTLGMGSSSCGTSMSQEERRAAIAAAASRRIGS
jgi:deubiquitinase DESI2